MSENERSQVSSIIGEKLLAGWTMTALSCQNEQCPDPAPLMKKPKEKTMICFGCNTKFLLPEDAGEVGGLMRNCDQSRRAEQGEYSRPSDSEACRKQSPLSEEEVKMGETLQQRNRQREQQEDCPRSSDSYHKSPHLSEEELKIGEKLQQRNCQEKGDACDRSMDSYCPPIGRLHASESKSQTLNVLYKKLNEAIRELEDCDVLRSADILVIIDRISRTIQSVKGM